MTARSVGWRWILVLAVAAALGISSAALAQNNNNNNNANININTAGVAVDAAGVLRMQTFPDPTGMLARQRMASARAAINPDVIRFSKLRKISLNRLEKAIRDRGGAVTDEMRYLAGLLRVKYVFFYPDSGDIVIAGPAEGWFVMPCGRVVGLGSGRPVVQLQDLVVALRAFPHGGNPTRLIGCSIDPTQEGLAAMQQFLRSIGSRATPNDTQYIVSGLQNSLGLQTVSINGVSPKTHFAQVMVEADYRMKLIGIGLEQPPVRLASYVERANPAMVSRNALCRWFFTPDYDCVRVSEDGLAMELVGDGVKLVGENELVTAGGQRQAVGSGNKASEAFVTQFTKLYPELAEKSHLYAELRNLIDLAVAAAYIQKADLCEKAGWKMDLLGDERRFAVETFNAPKKVSTAVNAIWKGYRLMTPIGGGVSIDADQALATDKLLPDEGNQVGRLRQETKIELAEGQWWWD
jgi:hypothetical protein